VWSWVEHWACGRPQLVVEEGSVFSQEPTIIIITTGITKLSASNDFEDCPRMLSRLE